ncbi:restriction endonuclease subunit S [Paenibacillus sp. NEAU-GSW1]|uniref:restriction endonuclease subunit S n=1 Tax=Paenibacillus sp. NEAU-GSW1 TaxID=2682486 RepID=UPI0012E1335E|nr:restriction endonuclease subunit S [Paenibacillus sp. NEAU-GSW1]MUT67840.1 restriction endonuclease subunit S [Paenibacillus sp. NEAU-GSW1]
MAKYKVSDLAAFNAVTLPKKHSLDYIQYLDTASLTTGIISEVKKLTVGIDAIPSRAQRVVSANDILISTVRPNQKHYGIIKQPVPNMIASSGFATISANEEMVSPQYLYYYLTQEEITSYLSAIAETSTSTFPAITPSVIKDLEMELPPKERQLEIAAILSAFDDKIKLNIRKNFVLERMAQAIYKQWFVDFNFPDANGEPYQASGGEMVWSEELGRPIPSGWSIGCLDDIADIASGKRPAGKSETRSEEYNIPLVGASSVMGYVNQALYNEPILVIGRVGTHGVVQRCQTECWPSDNTLVIQSEGYEYVHQVLKHIDYPSLNRGSTQPLITQTDVKNTKLALPDPETAALFEQTAGVLYERVENNKRQSEACAALRDTLIPRLMSGKLAPAAIAY